jgi:peptidoglycan/xylan/chitin deacetylase (PgdA/CDA1 family)
MIAGKALILMYHRVAEVHTDPFSICVAPGHFAEQLEVLRKHAHPLRLQDLCSALRTGTIPPRSVALTFDDGYADNLEAAKPLLDRHDTPATVFIMTGFIGSEREQWWDELERIFLEPRTLPESLDLYIQDTYYRAELVTPAQRKATYFAVWRLLQLMPEVERRIVLDRLAEWTGLVSQARPAYRGLSAGEVRTLADGGLIEIGAHTVTHPALPELAAAEQQSEIRQSKARLEEILDRPVISFAYPYGAQSAATAAIVREAGFHRACATTVGPVEPGVDPFQLPRVQVNDWDGAGFEQRLSAWFEAPSGSRVWSPLLESYAPELLIRGRWLFRSANGNAARLVFPAGDPQDVRIEIDRVATPASYDIQLNHPHLPVEANCDYEVHFLACADRPRSLSVGFAQAHEPWSGLGLYTTIALTPEWQSFRCPFTAIASDGNGRIHFDAGASEISIEVRGVGIRRLPG